MIGCAETRLLQPPLRIAIDRCEVEGRAVPHIDDAGEDDMRDVTSICRGDNIGVLADHVAGKPVARDEQQLARHGKSAIKACRIVVIGQ